jgi:hypothetical protein
VFQFVQGISAAAAEAKVAGIAETAAVAGTQLAERLIED